MTPKQVLALKDNDKVRCIDPNSDSYGSNELILGQIYSIARTNSNMERCGNIICLADGPGWRRRFHVYSPHRFELVKKTRQKKLNIKKLQLSESFEV